MRWFWVDRFTEFVSGSHAVGLKNVTLDEDAVDEYCAGMPALPPTLIIEGLAQLGGILVAEHFDFKKRVVLAKVQKATFHQTAKPGDQLLYRAEIDGAQEDGATVICTSHCGHTPQADIHLMFAFLDEKRFSDGPLFNEGDLSAMLRLMNFFHVAVDADGNPLPVRNDL